MPTTTRLPVLTVRRGLFFLVALSIGGAAFELATERHWQSPQQLLPWVALVALLVVMPFPRAVRVVAPIVLLVSAFGVYAHVSANLGTDPAASWWDALTKSVGFAPPLAPGMLAQSALLLLLTTLTTPRA